MHVQNSPGEHLKMNDFVFRGGGGGGGETTIPTHIHNYIYRYITSHYIIQITLYSINQSNMQILVSIVYQFTGSVKHSRLHLFLAIE